MLKSLAGLGLGAVLSTAVALPFTGLVSENPDPELNDGYGTLLFFGSFIVALLAVPVGLPGHAVLYALKRHGLVSYTLAGGCAGLAYILLVSLGGNPDLVKDLILYSLWAAGCALVAWLIRRPDKDAVVALDTHF
ncbi:hypothetical protein [Asticcacaulis sp. AC402]|uniref:hypothetical protein n=1 Tax=Asticcacaulis sp. AC402 TaxID=1282361 RepID=UPI0004CEC617|nr:hypothetical protein [Asticcacaulis sp. AC402]